VIFIFSLAVDVKLNNRAFKAPLFNRFMVSRKMFFIVAIYSSTIGVAYAIPSCIENANTQWEMNQCAETDLINAEAELNRVYKKIQERYKGEPIFLKKLLKAQAAWIKLREADFEMQYPYIHEEGYYGSSFSMCAFAYEEMLTLQRIEYLRKWLTKGEEGDICRGSVL